MYIGRGEGGGVGQTDRQKFKFSETAYLDSPGSETIECARVS